MSASWHRGDLRFGDPQFGDGGFSQRADAIKHLSWV
jgi:hypothetical protein